MLRRDARLISALLASTALSGPAFALDMPTGASVAAGGVAISSPSAAQMTIQQSTASAIVNWQGFSIGAGGRVDIQQPSASSALLNRVTGSTPSTIAGQLNANGQVYLVNPNGIAITSTGTVKAGGFVASTLGMSDDNFLSGKRTFSGNGSSAAVSNQGTIDIARGGYAALIGGQVDNAGTISVPMGKVGLAAGESVTLDLTGDGFLQVAVPSTGKDGALITHSGVIRAAGGRIEMQAATAREMARSAINLSGIVEARSVGGRSGAIVLGGGEGGRVTVSGRLDASARTASTARARHAAARRVQDAQRGGSVTVTGRDINFQAATVDVSGPAGGGTVRIGGDYQGGGTLQHAATTTVDAATVIRADATKSGDGGSVVLWSDALTSFTGLISAKGGPEGGNGGSAEVSGKLLLNYAGLADLSAANGSFGTLLLDPYNVTISTNPDTPTNTVAANGSLATPVGTYTGTQFTPNANDSNINATTLTTALATANVIVRTDTSAGTQAGNITVLAPLSWSAPTSLALNAAGAIVVNSAITAPNGGLGLQAATGVSVNAPLTFNAGNVAIGTFGNVALNAAVTAGGALLIQAGNTSGTIPTTVLPAVGTVTATGAVNTGSFVLNRGNWVQNSATLPVFGATNFTVNGDGTSTSPASFLRVLGGTGATGNPYLLTDVYGLQGVGTSANTLAASYALANNIDASGTANWNGGAGFNPIGYTGAASTVSQSTFVPFVGNFNGNNLSVSGLTINRPNNGGGVGLFGLVAGNDTTISNLALTNVNVVGGSSTGGLIGIVGFGIPGGTRVVNTTIANVSVSGQVAASGTVGGLIGTMSTSTGQTGTVSNSSSSASVKPVSGTQALAGGLIGGLTTYGGGSFTVTQSSATGAVSGTGATGGLIGRARLLSYADISGSSLTDTTPAGTISIANSTASGSVQATGSGAPGGGLVGLITVPSSTPSGSGITVSNSSASGSTTGAGSSGGLVGTNTGGTLTNVTATGNASGTAGVGGLVGVNSGAITGATASGQASGSSSNIGGLVGSNSGTIGNSTAKGAVSGQNNVGGLVGQNTGSVTGSGATGQTTGAGSYVGGLVGYNFGGAISQSTAGGNVSGSYYVGGLAGFSTGAVSNSSATGNASASYYVGGLLGYNTGSVSGSSASGQVNAPSGDAGGLVGYNTGTISGSTASGAVTGGPAIGGLVGYNSGGITGSNASGTTTGSDNDAGGLVGVNAGSIANSYATGNTSSSYHAGGLVGHLNSGATVTQSYATGTVQTTDTAEGGAGGLVGFSAGSVTQSFASGAVSGARNVGGLIGLQNGSVSDSYATGSATGGSNVGGLVGGLAVPSTVNSDTVATPSIATSYATGRVSGTSNTGGLVGAVQNAYSINSSYWDTQTTGQSSSAGTGATGQTTTQLTSGGLPSGFSSTVWGTAGGSYPYLLSLFPTGVVVPTGTGTTTTTPATPATPSNTVSAVAYSEAVTAPTLARQLPLTFVAVNTYPDSIDLNFGGGNGGGPTLGAGVDAGSGTSSQSRSTATATLNSVQRSSNELERKLANCEKQAAGGAGGYKSCVGDALDGFASDLDNRVLQLPPPLRTVTATIREAARRVRAATTVAEARAAVRVAVAEVRKAISLIRADEPGVTSIQRRQGTVIANALQAVDTKLARATGL